MGKKVIVVDLNPRSRSAVKASITIVDNVVRAMPLLIKETEKLKKKNKKQLMKIVRTYNNKKNLKNILNFMRKGV
jgi:4-phosphopantoate--beta-alanine ligase